MKFLLIKEERSNGLWFKYEYDSNNNLIKEEDKSSKWCNYEYKEVITKASESIKPKLSLYQLHLAFTKPI